MKRKGFTLVELLAVIVILAIISLIATPMILNIIEKTRKSAAMESANGILDAISLTMTTSEVLGENISSGQYNLEGEVLYVDDKEYKLEYKGDKNTTGTIVIEENKITNACFNIDNQDVYYDGEILNDQECGDKKSLKETLSTLPTKKININGQEVNKVYGTSRTGIKNYVWYSGQLWQVLEVNEDTIKMITAEPLTSISYGKTSDYKTSWVRDWLNEEFLSILTRKDLIVPTTYCLDSVNTSTDDLIYSSVSQDRDIALKVVNSHEKINTCSNSITDNVGLMTFEDYVYAYDAENANYTEANFLYNDELEWTMTPYSDNAVWITWFEIYKYITTGVDDLNLVNTGSKGVRPIISIKASALVSSGTGTNNNPYVLTSEKVVNENETISNVKVGDYVYLDESNNPFTYNSARVTSNISYTSTKDKVRYRVVKINDDGTVKVLRTDILRYMSDSITTSYSKHIPFYYKDSETESERCYGDILGKYGIEKKSYTAGCNGNNIFNPTQGSGEYGYSDSENIGYFLNNADNSFYNWYSDKTKNMLVESKWNLPVTFISKSYKNVLYNTNSSGTYPSRNNDGIVTAKIGLPQYGEIYSSNDLNQHYWFINRHNNITTSVSTVGAGGSIYSGGIYLEYVGVRPSVVLKSTVKIDSGKGTMTEPYTLKI